MRICLNKKANNNFARAECKRERKEGQSLCHGCVAEGIHHMEDELYIPISVGEPQRPRPTPEPTGYRVTTSTASSAWYSDTATTTAI